MRLVVANIILVIVLFAGCVKQKTYYIKSAMLREAATIKEGSYFIYRDSLTGFEDSFNVYYYINTTKNYQGDDARIQEFIIGTMHNIDSSKNLGYFIDAKVILDKEWLNFTYYESGIRWNSVPLTDPITSHQDIKTLFIEKRENYVLNTINYGTVFIYQSIDSSNKYIKSYYSPSHGLVKFEANNNSFHKTYELVRSHINR